MEIDTGLISSRYFTDVHVEQESVPGPAVGEDEFRASADYMLVKIGFHSAIYDRLGLEGPDELDSYVRNSVDPSFNYNIYVELESIKKIRSPYRLMCRRDFADHITEGQKWIDIPKQAHRRAMGMLLRAIDKAVNPDLPIHLELWQITRRTWETSPPSPSPPRINFVPATSDSIQGLERLMLQVVGDETTCAICLQQYDQPAPVVVRLPCSHYFHTDCIVLWLHTHHKCPLCRLAV